MSQSEDHPLTRGDQAFFDAYWQQWRPPPPRITDDPGPALQSSPLILSWTEEQLRTVITQAVEEAVKKAFQDLKINLDKAQVRHDKIPLGSLRLLPYLQLPEACKIYDIQYDPAKDHVDIIVERLQPPDIPLD